MPKNDREVWDYIRQDVSSASEFHQLFYAIYADQKYDWIDHFEKDFGSPPSNDDIDQWISQITPNRFSMMREKAADLFDRAARSYLRHDIAQQCQQAVDQSILGAVKSASSFWKQAAFALITAILAPLIIGGMIVAAQSYDRFYPTASGVSHNAPLEQPAVPKP